MKKGAAAPFGEIDVVNFSYPRWARESGSAASIEGASPLTPSNGKGMYEEYKGTESNDETDEIRSAARV